MNTRCKSISAVEHDDVLLITICREHKRNALDADTVLGLADVLTNIPPAIRSAVLTGEGNNFSAGLDLAELVEQDTFACVQHSRLWHRCWDAVQFAPVPVIAALHGAVIGGGLELAVAAHIRVSDRSAYFALPEAARGIFVGGGGSARLPRIVGFTRMADMMLTGRVLDADESQSIGLSQYLVPEGKAVEKAMELARRVAQNTALTNFAVTHVLPRIADSSQEVGLLTESLIASLAQSDPAAKRRLADFLEGRAAKVAPQSQAAR